MKSYRKEVWFNIPDRRGFVNITPDLETCLGGRSIMEDMCHLKGSILQIPLSIQYEYCEFHLPIFKSGSEY
jgi:hypothetical protein